ncbi:hypothetical protein GCM10011584_30390 [Nocardioides phosphati]|uniref:MazG C-terminal domain-containing protein n=1 Tax=Nocardioides phosphati TaxID=1867775 RepID=A0ABQ2NDV4_9ACTN|nr:hypothetical protein [Nocardioides phosphati]GGO92904.1 hypothetical protein GCM10011584_30390 [Nocardioides phosphati]
MEIAAYQQVVADAQADDDTAHELVPLLGTGAHVGAILDAQQRFLRNTLSAAGRTRAIERAVGRLVRWCTVVANGLGLDFDEVARANLRKVDQRHRSLGHGGITAEMPVEGRSLTFSYYARLAAETDQDIGAGSDPLELSVPLLGLAGEVGSLFVEQKKRYRGDSKISNWQAFVAEELGDLLWYSSAVCRHLGADIDTVMKGDADRLQGVEPVNRAQRHKPFDATFPQEERFPRQLQLRFVEDRSSGEPKVTMTLIDAVPNAFPDGAIPLATGDMPKMKGYTVGQQLGDQVDNNSHRDDAYRYHDAIHLGFLAVLQWSPNLRNLLRIKRKSVPTIDDNEDGARAVFAEEGLAAILAKQAFVNDDYLEVRKVPEELLELIASVTDDLEVSILSVWLWAEAICQGFQVLRLLALNRGGFVLADLDAGQLRYSKTPFSLERGTP